MNGVSGIVLANHRGQMRFALATSLVASLLAIAPTNSRALFVVRDPGVTALSAIVPAPIVPDFGRFLIRVGNPFVPSPVFRRAITGGGAPSVDTPFAEPPEEFTLPDPGTLFVPDGLVMNPLSLGDPTGFIPSLPLAFGPPTASPVGFIDQPVPAVPEPSAWLMMIVGFLGIGILLRRRQVKSFEPDAVFSEGYRLEAR